MVTFGLTIRPSAKGARCSLITYLTILFLFFVASGLQAQSAEPQLFFEKNGQSYMLLPDGSVSESSSNEHTISPGIINGFDTGLHHGPAANAPTVSPIAEIYERIPWNENPALNFRQSGAFLKAGDLTGNGQTDLMRTYAATPDERDPDPAATTPKTLIFFAGNFTTEPDFIIYDELQAVGDILGDGKDRLVSFRLADMGIWRVYTISENGYSMEEIEAPVTESAWTPLFADLNGDGFHDMATTLVDSSSELLIRFGTGTISLNLNDLIFDGEDFFSTVIPKFVFTHSGDRYLLLLAQYFNDDLLPRGKYSLVLRYEEEELSLAQILQVGPGAFGNFFHLSQDILSLVDTPAHGQLLLFSSTRGNPSFNPESRLFPFSEDEENLFVPFSESIGLGNRVYVPMGDVFDNGSTDLIYSFQQSEWRFASLSENLTSGGAVIDGDPLPMQDELQFPNHTSPPHPVGDFTMNGWDDVIFPYTQTPEPGSTYGQLVFEGNTQNLQLIAYPEPERRIAREVLKVGDITGNGLDDFVIYWVRSLYSNYLTLHEGGSDWQTPYFTFELQAGQWLSGLTAGNFTDLNRRDIAFIAGTASGGTATLEIYAGGSSPSAEPYLLIDGPTFRSGYPNYTNFYSLIENAGDVNNSGYDDLLVTTLGPNTYPQLPSLLYGGENMQPGPPDHVFEFDNYASNGRGAGGTLKGLGDINGDGIDDFAIGNFDEKGTLDDNAFGGLNVGGGRVHIFLGQDGEPDFSTSDYILRPNIEDLEAGNTQYHLGFSEIAAGDFTGDGLTDFAVKTFRHYQQSEFYDGIPGVHIFHGSELEPGENLPQQMLPLYSVNHNLTSEIPIPEYELMGFGGRFLMSAVADPQGQSADALLVIATGATNAVIHSSSGDGFMNTMPDVVYKAPNSRYTMGGAGNFINRHYKAVIGDFNGDNTLNFITTQRNDSNFLDTPVYMYAIETPPVSIEPPAHLPDRVELNQNYPNPFNPTTRIEFSLPEAGHALLEVYNVQGQRVATLQNGTISSGTHTFSFDGSRLSSGLYIYRLSTAGTVLTRKMMLIK